MGVQYRDIRVLKHECKIPCRSPLADFRMGPQAGPEGSPSPARARLLHNNGVSLQCQHDNPAGCSEPGGATADPVPKTACFMSSGPAPEK
jgi:hypothetical protein